MYEAMAPLIGDPWLALVPAALCLAVYLYSRRRLALLSAGLWLFYCAYEYGMTLRVLCSGECNIRVDLLLIYPLLLLATAASLLTIFFSRTTR